MVLFAGLRGVACCRGLLFRLRLAALSRRVPSSSAARAALPSESTRTAPASPPMVALLHPCKRPHFRPHFDFAQNSTKCPESENASLFQRLNSVHTSRPHFKPLVGNRSVDA